VSVNAEPKSKVARGRSVSKAQRGRDYVAELASPSSLSLAVTLFYLPFGLLGPVFIDAQRLGGPIFLWLLIGLVGQLVLMFIVLLGKRVADQISRVGTRAAFTVFVFVAATSARGSAIAALVFGLGYTDMPEFRYRFGAAVFPQTVTLVVIALALTHFQSNLKLVQSLESEKSRIVKLQSSTYERLLTYRETLLLEVKQSLFPVTRRLQEALDTSRNAGSDQGQVMQLSQLVDTEMKPLVTKLAKFGATVSLRKPVAPKARSLEYAFPAKLSLRSAISPRLSGLLILLSAIGQSARDLSPAQGWVFVVVTGVGMTLLVGLLRALLGRWSPPVALAITLAALANALSAGLVVWLQPLLGLPTPGFLLVPAMGIGALIGLFTSVYQAMNQRQQELEGLLRSVNGAYRANVSLLRQQMWLVRRKISILVHGVIQSALRVAILKIQSTPRMTDDVAMAIRADISNAFDELDDDQLVPSEIEDLLAEIALTWQGVVTVDYSVSDAKRRGLNDNDACRWCVNEIALEAVHNAVVHGEANQVNIKVTNEEFEVIVEVVDDGAGLSGNDEPGLGSQMLDEICVEWKRWRDDDGTHLKAILSSESALRFTSDRTIALKEAR
jgi:hypothetical protein